MRLSPTILAVSLIAGIFITAALSVWAYSAKEDEWDLKGSEKSLQALDAEIPILATNRSLSSSFIKSEASGIKDNALKEGDSMRSLELTGASKSERDPWLLFAQTLASSSERLEK